ncbi:DUF2244 domain-containing protein [Pseudophaeobacter sp.]|uniref:DUF2244 domain-containing protein n=1 Tax=Pseudophaeobacter sp. TaxID=1971739 RepID=UPI00329A474E
MPYRWLDQHPSTSEATEQTKQVLHLWPHQSLPPEGYARFLSVTALLIALPLLSLLGSFLLWWLLPFLLLALFGMKWALDRNRRDAQILEVLTIDANEACLERTTLGGPKQSWQCNRYWVTVEMHTREGPVPNYVTLRGGPREVEIGSFLSEDERKALYQELVLAF